MYDTLMQMGRWFGYRTGYVDLCRLYTSQQLIDWYKFIAIATEELREEFNNLAEINGTPDQFALKVRTHPGQLQVTALGKRRNSTAVDVSWAGKLVETRMLCKDEKARDYNLDITDKFVKSLGKWKAINKSGIEGESGIEPNCFIWNNVKANKICDFIADFRLPETYKKISFDRIIDFIRKVVVDTKGMNSWNVCIISKARSSSKYTFSNGLSIGCCTRNRDKDITYSNVFHMPKNRIKGNPADEFVDLDKKILDEALNETKEIKRANGKEWKQDFAAPELVRIKYRDKSTPLLSIYPITPQSANLEQEKIYEDIDNKPIIGFTIAFPDTEGDIVCRYLVNKVVSFVDNDANDDEVED